MRTAALLVAVAVLLAGCGNARPPDPAAAEPVAEYVRSLLGGSRTIREASARACAALLPRARRDLVAAAPALTGLAAESFAGSAGSFAAGRAPCEASLTVLQGLGAMRRGLLGVIDVAATSDAVTVVSTRGGLGWVRVGGSRKTVAVIRLFGRWRIARLDFFAG